MTASVVIITRLQIKKMSARRKHLPALPVPARKRQVRVIVYAEICPLCHKPLENHEFCDSCGIGIGENHHEKKTFYAGGNHICRWCKNHGYTQRSKDNSEYTD